MATNDWAIPTGKAVTGATYIKDTDDYIAATIEDLVDWCNNANGTYTDWTLTGLRTDFLDKNTAQTITAVKTIDTLGAIDFTGGELRVGGVAVTSSAAELNLLDGATVTTAEINILDGVTSTTAELNILDGVTATTAELNILDGVTSTTAELNILDGVTATATEINTLDGITALDAGTYVPTISGLTNLSSATPVNTWYTRINNIVTVSGAITLNVTSLNTATRFDMTIPINISTTFTSNGQTAGYITDYVQEPSGGEVFSVSATKTVRAAFVSGASASGSSTYSFSFTYKII